MSLPACPEGQVRQADGQCSAPDYCAPNAGKWVGSGSTSDTKGDYYMEGEGTAVPSEVCIAGCSATVNSSFSMALPGTVQKWGFRGDVQITGAQCTPTPESAPEPEQIADTDAPETKCILNGQGYGYVNGTVVCTPPPDGRTDTATEVQTDNQTGQTTTTTTTTSYENGQKTTTTTTEVKDGQGNVIGGSSTTTTGPAGPGFVAPGQQGQGDTECEGANCTGTGGTFASGAIYEEQGRSIADSYNGFIQSVQATPVFTAADGFFQVSAGGNCPTWSGTIPYLEATIVIDHFCRPEMATALLIASYVVLIVGAVVGFRIAFL